MKLPAIFTVAIAALLPGCGFVNKTVGTAANLAGGIVNTVTAPLHMAEPDGSSRQAWREKLDALKKEDTAKNDRRPAKTKRRN